MLMKRILLGAGLLIALWLPLAGQGGFYFGLKGGLTVGIQKWDQSFQRDPLLRYHGIIFTESYSEEDKTALFAQLGYHVKGSAIRTYRTVVQFPDGTFRDVPARQTPFEFENISLSVGAKQKFPLGLGSNKVFYMIGIRGDYTVNTNLRPVNAEEFGVYNLIFPFEEFVNKFNFGAILGGGIQFEFTELVGGVLEFTVNPDFTRQYNQPEIPNVINPNPNFGSGTITIRERQISNTTFEVTLGLRFLRKVIYID